MDHHDHVHLIETGVEPKRGIWADFGSGTGAFTLALADILFEGSEIYSIDKDQTALKQQKKLFEKNFPGVRVTYINKNFTGKLILPTCDGIIMANSLHYVSDQISYLRKVRKYLKNNGRLIIIEYNSDKGNYWVPNPVSFERLKKISKEAGFTFPQLLHTIPSSFLREIYSAYCINI